METEYNQQPTLLIGLGGIGSQIVDNIYGTLENHNPTIAYCIDTDKYTVKSLEHISDKNFINILPSLSVSNLFNLLPDAPKWFSYHPVLMHKTIAEGAGQVRSLARLAYECQLLCNSFDNLLDSAHQIAQECVKKNCRMRISIVTSLCGGTGAGIYIQIALMIRKYITQNFPLLNVKIHGEFILPSYFSFVSSNAEKRNMESIAYASLKELNAINEYYFCNGSAIELNYYKNQQHAYIDLLPYDYCFLYGTDDHTQIESSIVERLFGKASNAINDAFVNNLRTNTRKHAGNIYGILTSRKYSSENSLPNTGFHNLLTEMMPINKGKYICSITSPENLSINQMYFTNDTVFIQSIDPASAEMTFTTFCYGIELKNIEQFKYETGQYFRSYKAQVKNLPQGITPHLNKKWHETLNDIGYEPENISLPQVSLPKEGFVFISYSSKDVIIADQTKHILETNGIPCWMAPQSIPAGSDYGSEIPTAINNCKAFLLLLSQASQESNWVPKEVGLAIGKGKTVIPFQIDNSIIRDSFNFYLTNSQRISAYNRMTDAYQELVMCLQRLLRL